MAAGTGPPDGTCIIHHRTDELLVKKHIISDGQATSPVKERTKYAQYLSCLFSSLVDMCRPGHLCIKGHPNISCCFDQLYWLSEKMDWSGLLDASRSLNREHSGALWEVDGNPPVPHPVLKSTEISLQIPDEKRWTEGRGYESRVVRDVAEWWRYVVYIPTEQHRGELSTLGHPGTHDTACGCGWLEGRLERSAVKIWGYGFHQVRQEV
jgi:hypothetical protein